MNNIQKVKYLIKTYGLVTMQGKYKYIITNRQKTTEEKKKDIINVFDLSGMTYERMCYCIRKGFKEFDINQEIKKEEEVKQKKEANEIEEKYKQKQQQIKDRLYKKNIENIIEKNKELENKLEFITQLKHEDKNNKKIGFKNPIQEKDEKELIPILVLSDWHVEENVDPKTVNDLNDYNNQIARYRSEKVFSNALKMIQKINGSDTKNKTFIIALLGDFISGYIHEELMENNDLSPTQAILSVKSMICNGIDLFLRETDYSLIIPCSYGNHGRTGEKKKVATGYKNSYEWLMYNIIEERYRGNKRIDMKISKGYFNYLKVFNYNLRFHHGDNIRGGNGIAGITAPINNCIRKWNMGIKADYDIFGHFHQNINHKNFVCNGSMIGVTPYGLNFGYEEPSQALFFLNKKHGKNIYIPIFCK